MLVHEYQEGSFFASTNLIATTENKGVNADMYKKAKKVTKTFWTRNPDTDIEPISAIVAEVRGKVVPDNPTNTDYYDEDRDYKRIQRILRAIEKNVQYEIAGLNPREQRIILPLVKYIFHHPKRTGIIKSLNKKEWDIRQWALSSEPLIAGDLEEFWLQQFVAVFEVLKAEDMPQNDSVELTPEIQDLQCHMISETIADFKILVQVSDAKQRLALLKELKEIRDNFDSPYNIWRKKCAIAAGKTIENISGGRRTQE